MEKKTPIESQALESGGSAKRVLLIVAAGAVCLGLAFLALTLALSSCSASVSSAIKADGSARIVVEAEIPDALSSKIRKLSGAGGQAARESILDPQTIRRALESQPGIDVQSVSQPKTDSIRVVLAVGSLEALAASPRLKGSGILKIEKGPAATECRFHLERGNAKALSSLFDGINPDLMDALSPPALEEDPLSLDDYRAMLKNVFGEKAMAALEASSVKLSIVAPGQVLASSGGTLSGATLKASIPIVELLALEKPVDMVLRWK